MELSSNALGQILANARALCSPEGDKKINEYKVSGSMNFDDPDPASFVDPYENFGSADEPSAPSAYATQPMATQFSERALSNARIPAAIRESFARKQIDVSGLSNASVLDQMPAEVKQKIAGSVKVEKKAPVTEVATRPVQQMAGFDYTALKAVIKECLQEYFKEQPLNESASLRQITLKEGRINLVDNKGNVFGADLEFKKNINDKK